MEESRENAYDEEKEETEEDSKELDSEEDEDPAELSSDESEDSTGEEESVSEEEAAASGKRLRRRYPIRNRRLMCTRYKRCIKTKCSHGRLCGRRQGYCTRFVNCLCYKRKCEKNYRKYCVPVLPGPCKKLLSCMRKKCQRGGSLRARLCSCQKKNCLWQFRERCKKFPLKRYDLGQVQDENMAATNQE